MKEHFPYKPHVVQKTAGDKSSLSLKRAQEMQTANRSSAPTDTYPPLIPTDHIVTMKDLKRILNNIFGTDKKNGKK